MPLSLARELVHPDYRDEFINVFAAIDRGESSISGSFRTSDGSKWCKLTLNLVKRDEHGYVESAFGIIQNISRLRLRELAHQNELAGYSLQLARVSKESKAVIKRKTAVVNALSNIYISNCYIDLRTELLSTITGLEYMLNMLGREGEARHIFEVFVNGLVAEDYRDIMFEFLDLDTLQERMGAQHSISVEYISIRKGWCRGSFVEVERDESGKLTAVLFTVEHIDEGKKRELRTRAELEKALKAANKANEAKSEFLSRMSHDIRTPINGVLGMLEISEHYIDDRAKLKECHEKIRVSANYLLSLISDVLDMSKLEMGRLELSSEAFDIRDLLKSCIEIIRPLAIESNITLETQSLAGMRHPYLIGSPTHIRQIFVNIATNAIKYNKPNGRVRATFDEYEWTADTVTYKLIIEDNGIGMSEEYQKHMFESFSQQNPNAGSRYQGSGLGLAIVKRIVDLMGGKIEVWSREGVGSRFTVTLPFKVDRDYIAKKPAIATSEQIPPKDIRVMIVEDNELNMEIAQFMLDEIGAKYTKATNGKEAVEKFKDMEVGGLDLILMDVMMPVMNGYAATSAIRSLDRADAQKVPIIAMTANAYAEDVIKAKNAGMNEHLSKPVERDKLYRLISKYARERSTV
jgi:signal transduction histidine kinase/CheY-like chemotaxis protein